MGGCAQLIDCGPRGWGRPEGARGCRRREGDVSAKKRAGWEQMPQRNPSRARSTQYWRAQDHQDIAPRQLGPVLYMGGRWSDMREDSVQW